MTFYSLTIKEKVKMSVPTDRFVFDFMLKRCTLSPFLTISSV
jgi:hypothetical protein